MFLSKFYFTYSTYRKVINFQFHYLTGIHLIEERGGGGEGAGG